MVLQHAHDSPLKGHSGYLKTVHRVQQDFFWYGMKKDIKEHIKNCETCQRIKVDTIKPAGLLQPLSIPDKPWLDISMDLITGLPKSQVYDVILVVVDRLTKFVRFMPLSHPYIAAMVAQVFMTIVFKLHDLPRSIMSDRDAAFTPTFWKELFKLQGTELAMSSTYHPQFDG